MTLNGPSINNPSAFSSFAKVNTMLLFDRTYSSIPPGVYFASEFSITLWFKTYGNVLTDNLNWPRIFDFIDTTRENRIVLNLGGRDGFYLYFKTDSNQFQIGATQAIPYNTWSFVTVTYDKYRLLRYYFNETSVGQGQCSFVRRVARTDVNYFGSENNGIADATFKMFDFKIYNRAITKEEVLIEFNRGIVQNTVQTMIKN